MLAGWRYMSTKVDKAAQPVPLCQSKTRDLNDSIFHSDTISTVIMLTMPTISKYIAYNIS